MSTTKIIFLFALAISLSSTKPLFAQITGNLHVQDPKALMIGPDQTALLVDKRWNCSNMIDRRREVLEERQPRDNTARFVSTGEYKDARTKTGSGFWEIVNNQFIKVSVTPSSPTAKNLLHGAYSIYEISDSTLVLAQILTSSGDWVREFRFTTGEVIIKPTPVMHIEGYPNFSRARPDSLHDGKRIRYFNNGKIAAIENYKLQYRKMIAGDLFIEGIHLPIYGDSMITNSVRVGEWTTFYPSGGIQAKEFFNDNGFPTSNWVTYSQDGRVAQTSSYGKGGWTFHDWYEYRENRTMPLIKRTFFNQMQPCYIMGSRDSIKLDRALLRIVDQAGAIVTEKIHFTSLSGMPIQVNVQRNLALGVSATQLTLNPYDTIDIVWKIKVPPGSTSEAIIIQTEEWTLDMPVNVFGYHLSVLTFADFEAPNKKQLPTKFVFHKTADEYQLEIVDLHKKSRVKSMAVSKQMNEIELRPGEYQFTLVGKNGRKAIAVEIR